MAKKKVEPATDVKPVSVTRIIQIETPSGKCPVKLKGITEDEILEWAEAVQEHGQKNNRRYLSNALIYWVHDATNHRDFTREEFNFIRDLLRERYGYARISQNYEEKNTGVTPAEFLHRQPAAEPKPPQKSAGVDSFEIGEEEVQEENIKLK